jgi:hypothetical protein
MVTSLFRRLFASRLLPTLAALLFCGPASAQPLASGVMWQLYEQAPDARGNWHKLGVRELFVQWLAVDGIAYVPGTGLRETSRMPDWRRVSREPWAEGVIAGLSGRTNEAQARRSLAAMAEESRRIASLKLPFRVSAWYFPAEVDPTWKEAASLMPIALERLPRPLWISAYDGGDTEPGKYAAWIASWLPRDVGVMFQDGVGLRLRTPASARGYVQALAAKLGAQRVAMIAEAFRTEGGKMRPATAGELKPQLAAYRGLRIYIFDGPHYLPELVVNDLLSSKD